MWCKLRWRYYGILYSNSCYTWSYIVGNWSDNFKLGWWFQSQQIHSPSPAQHRHPSHCHDHRLCSNTRAGPRPCARYRKVDGAQWCLLVYVHPMKRKSYPPNRPEFSKFIAPTICAIVWGPQLVWGKNMECHDIARGDLILMFKISSTFRLGWIQWMFFFVWNPRLLAKLSGYRKTGLPFIHGILQVANLR